MRKTQPNWNYDMVGMYTDCMIIENCAQVNGVNCLEVGLKIIETFIIHPRITFYRFKNITNSKIVFMLLSQDI